MGGRLRGAGWFGALVLSLGWASAFATSSEAHGAEEAYLLTLQVLAGLPSCGDRFGRPEYYGAVSRRDPEVEKELDGIERELDKLEPRIAVFDERVEPLEEREHNTVPLSDTELQELEALRERRLELEHELGKLSRHASLEERQALERERSETDRSMRRLEDSIPLTDDEARFLRQQRAQRAPLAERRSALRTREDEIRDLISMRTPGSLRVYPNDSLRLRLMEDDAFEDDTCATWQLGLDRETLDRGGIDLESGDRPLLRVWLQPVRPE